MRPFATEGDTIFPKAVHDTNFLKRESITKGREGLCMWGMTDPRRVLSQHWAWSTGIINEKKMATAYGVCICAMYYAKYSISSFTPLNTLIKILTNS